MSLEAALKELAESNIVLAKANLALAEAYGSGTVITNTVEETAPPEKEEKPAAKEPEPETQEDDDDDLLGDGGEAEEEAVTQDDLKGAMTSLIADAKQKGADKHKSVKDALLAVLDNHGAAKLSEVQEADYGKVMAGIKKVRKDQGL